MGEWAGWGWGSLTTRTEGRQVSRRGDAATDPDVDPGRRAQSAAAAATAAHAPGHAALRGQLPPGTPPDPAARAPLGARSPVSPSPAGLPTLLSQKSSYGLGVPGPQTPACPRRRRDIRLRRPHAGRRSPRGTGGASDPGPGARFPGGPSRWSGPRRPRGPVTWGLSAGEHRPCGVGVGSRLRAAPPLRQTTPPRAHDHVPGLCSWQVTWRQADRGNLPKRPSPRSAALDTVRAGRRLVSPGFSVRTPRGKS